MPAARPSRSSWLVGAAVAALLVAHFGLAWGAASRESVTSDEILHLTGGYFYDRFGDFRLHPENGNLPQRWAALPAVLSGAPAPELRDNVYWRTSDVAPLGHQFFYESGHDHWPMLMAGRAMIALFSVATGLLVFCWSRRQWGNAAGLLALTFYGFDPNVLAHAALVTSDTVAVFFLVASCGALWRHLRAPAWGNGTLSALVIGLAAVAKYSAVLLLPIAVFMVLAAGALVPGPERVRWLRTVAFSAFAHLATAAGVIWLFFDFRYSGFAPDLPPAAHFIVPWEQVLPALGWQGKVVQFCREWRLLPEAFLYGYAWVIQSAQARGAFLAGDYSMTGWVQFFPLAFLWKTPAALLVALAIGGAKLLARWREAGGRIWTDAARVAPLVALFVVYGLFSLASHLNIGHRHILPLYPVLFVLTGALAAPGVLVGRWRRPILGGLIAGLLWANVSVAPHYLAFFNRFAGGPTNGWRLLVDSSLDWGQDLPGLRDWLQRQSAATTGPVFISYFGSGSPDYYQVRGTRLPFLNGFKRIHPWYELAGGTYCISATMLQQVYNPARGPWTLALEREYQQLRTRVPYYQEYWRNSALRDELDAAGQARAFQQEWVRFDLLRFTRLCHYLRARQPDALIGYSILVYRVTDQEISAAVDRSFTDWAAAIAGAGARH